MSGPSTPTSILRAPAAQAGPVRLACWPASSAEPYLQSQHRALAGHGVQVVVDGMPVEDSFLAARANDIDVIHLHWAEYLWGAGRGRAQRLRGVAGLWRFLRQARHVGVPVVWTVHNRQPHGGGDWIDVLGLRLLAAYSDLVICHDEHSGRIVGRHRRADDQPLVMGIGNNRLIWPPPDPGARMRAHLGIGIETRLLVCLGQLRPYKGFELAIAALAGLGPGYHLLVVGAPVDAGYAARLDHLAKNRDGVTVMAEAVDDQALVDWLSAADAVLLPYREITGSGALLAACTAGVGVVAADLPYFRAFLERYPDLGELCRPGDAADLAVAVRRFFAVPITTRRRAALAVADAHEWPVLVAPLADRLRRMTVRRRAATGGDVG